MKKLHRSEKDRVITGICGGIGEYLNIDPTIIRILFVILSLNGGSGLLLYIILLIIIPEEADEQVAKTKSVEKKKK